VGPMGDSLGVLVRLGRLRRMDERRAYGGDILLPGSDPSTPRFSSGTVGSESSRATMRYHLATASNGLSAGSMNVCFGHRSLTPSTLYAATYDDCSRAPMGERWCIGVGFRRPGTDVSS
jgi:hypothetical protein